MTPDTFDSAFAYVNKYGQCIILTVLSNQDVLKMLKGVVDNSMSELFQTCHWYILVQNFAFLEWNFQANTLINLVAKSETRLNIYDW